MGCFDSRGNPTVEVVRLLDTGRESSARSCRPVRRLDGLSSSATELRDGDERYGGKGVLQAVGHVEGEIADALKGLEASEQRLIDLTMIDLDASDGKSRLGANAILVFRSPSRTLRQLTLTSASFATSAASTPPQCCRVPMMNVFPNGGVHADNNIDFQEFMIVPHGAASYPARAPPAPGRKFETYHHALKSVLHWSGTVERGRR